MLPATSYRKWSGSAYVATRDAQVFPGGPAARSGLVMKGDLAKILKNSALFSDFV